MYTMKYDHTTSLFSPLSSHMSLPRHLPPNSRCVGTHPSSVSAAHMCMDGYKLILWNTGILSVVTSSAKNGSPSSSNYLLQRDPHKWVGAGDHLLYAELPSGLVVSS